MGTSLEILKDDMLKMWSEIEMSQISMGVGFLFCLFILMMSLITIDRRDAITELLYATYITFVTLILLIVIPDTMRPQSSREAILVTALFSVFVAIFRWNIEGVKSVKNGTKKQTHFESGT